MYHERVKYAFGHHSKPYLNELSPGCRTCGRGTWACVFISHACTRDCFFCLRKQEQAADFVPYVERDIKLPSVERLIEYIGSFHFDGISFSGGEPFLQFDRLFEYVSAIRKAFGDHHYVWVYTNGDPVTADRLDRLAVAGLDEIRFDISARDYELGPLNVALGRIPHVTVEIPAIPEDVERVKVLLPRLESMGVEYVNLHQLMMNHYNETAFRSRGYGIKPDARFSNYQPVTESFSAAMEILNHAAKHDLQMGINCCTRLYKHYFQERGFRRRYAPLCRSDHEEITPTGFLRGLTKCEDSESNTGQIDLMDPDGSPVKVAYSTPALFSNSEKDTQDTCCHLQQYGARVRRWVIEEFELGNQTAQLFFQLLFVDNLDIDTAFKELVDLYEPGREERESLRSELEAFFRRFGIYEYIPPWET